MCDAWGQRPPGRAPRSSGRGKRPEDRRLQPGQGQTSAASRGPARGRRGQVEGALSLGCLVCGPCAWADGRERTLRLVGTRTAPALPPQSDVPWPVHSLKHAVRVLHWPGSRRPLAVPSTVFVDGRPLTPERAGAGSCSPPRGPEGHREPRDGGTLSSCSWVPSSLFAYGPLREAALAPAAQCGSECGAAGGADAPRGLRFGDPRGQDARPRVLAGRRRVYRIRRLGALVDWRVGGTACGPDCFHEGPRALRPPRLAQRLQRRGPGRASTPTRGWSSWRRGGCSSVGPLGGR